MKRQARKTRQPNHQMRWRFVLGFWLVCACVLVVRAVDLQVIQHGHKLCSILLSIDLLHKQLLAYLF